MASIFTAPVYKLEELNNVFVEMTSKNCNQRCESCYIDFGKQTGFGRINKLVKDFIHIEHHTTFTNCGETYQNCYSYFKRELIITNKYIDYGNLHKWHTC